MAKEMTLFEFTDYLRDNIGKFKLQWLKNNDENPDDWPIEMGLGDWLEQFELLDSE